MTTSWKPPSWSKIPPTTQQWHLDELKNGNIVATHSLNDLLLSSSSNNNNRRCITFGRIDDPTQIDIVTAHESCSRLHARIAFTSNGTPYLKDLGSGNGTFVNNQQLPIEACGKWECTNSSTDVEVRGSRGVVLYPGDAIRFGCSTRIFVLEGPEEFERGATRVQKKMEVDDAALQKTIANNDDDDVTAAASSAEKDEEVCTWGMSTVECSDEQEDEDEGQPPRLSSQSNNNTNHDGILPSIDSFFSSSPSTKYTISNSLQQLYNQYQTKIYKLDAISTESKRISQKEDMGVELTDGQRNQLAKNQDKLKTLETSVRGLKEKIEEGMHVAIYGKPSTRQGQKKREESYGDADDDHVDDFFDRTSSSSKRQHDDDNDDGGEADSEASLIQKWKVLLQSYSKQQNVVSSTMKRCNHLQIQVDSARDEEDAFFIQNDLNLVKGDVKKATRRLEEIERDLKGVERLLKIVNPKLSWDREEGLIGIGLQKTKLAVQDSQHADNVELEQNESMMMPPPPKAAAAATTTSVDSFDMPPPPRMTTATAKSAVTSFDMMPPPPKVMMSAPESVAHAVEQGVIPEHPMNPNHVDRGTLQEGEEQPPPALQKKKRQLGPMRPPAGTQGTLAALKQFTSHSNEATNDSCPAKKQKKSKDNSTTLSFDPRKDEWNAPSDQDGSGRTSLHDKFKGRY
jgi:pSer/pThr/pTyr-binding forkhead associated (FHA) protein